METIVKEKYQQVVDAAAPLLRGNDLEFIEKAFHLALEKSTAMNLPSSDQPYICKILDTALLAINNINLAGKALVSIFLHEFAFESISLDQITAEYGSKVAVILEGLKKVQKLDTAKVTTHSENFIRLVLTQAEDVRSILVLLAIKLYDVRNFKSLPESSKDTFGTELTSLYAPLAHRLGLYAMKTEMEEQSMKHLYNDTYRMIAKKLAETKASRDAFIKEFIELIKNQLDSLHVPYEIKGRPKSIHSIWTKIRKGKVEFEKIYDLFAIRIIIDSTPDNEKADCWNVYSLVSDTYRPNPNRLRDWISAPKTSGYESLHTTVLGPGGKWVEVQIRTRRMDEIAEKGLAAHWKYKGGKQGGNETSWLARVREALETNNADGLEEASSARMELYSDEIFIFTPTGDLRKIASGATILDFAYEVHSSLGDTCTGGKVNGKIVPIRQVIKNGDRVEILTSKNQTPNRDWLNFVITSKARNKIKRFLTEQENKEAEEGREILMRKLAQVKVKFDDESVHRVARHFKAKTVVDMYVRIAKNEIDTSSIKALFDDLEKPDTDKKPNKIDNAELQGRLHRKFHKEDESNYLILDESLDKIEYKLAKCCNPIKGDEIFGFVSASSGVKIHRLNCPNAMQMLDKYSYRIVKAKWTSGSGGGAKFLAGIRVTGADEVGIVSSITQIISQDHKITLRGFNVESRDGLFEGKITLFISDLEHLDSFIRKILAIKGVHKASRFDTRA